MEIHKGLLASISPELNKHVNNNMREGIEGIIHLPDDEEEVVTLFSEWAYTGDYSYKQDTTSTNTQNYTEPKNDPWLSLHKHLELCVFSDKFNIPILKQLAESKFHSEIRPLRPKSKKDAESVVMLIGYAYENLPSSDPILKFLAQYASWKLELLRPTPKFDRLILTHPGFLKKLLKNLEGLKTQPTATAPQKSITYDEEKPYYVTSIEVWRSKVPPRR